MGVELPTVLVRLVELVESSAKCARFPEGVADLESEDLVLPRDERRVADEVLAEDHMAVSVRGVLDFCCDLEDGGGVGSLVSTSMSSGVDLRSGRSGEAEMSSALRMLEDWSSVDMLVLSIVKWKGSKMVVWAGGGCRRSSGIVSVGHVV